MAIVEVSFSALPVHVRTARMIVTAVARRSGVDETLLDEVRLAVGEACSRAVEAHQKHCPDEPVRLQMDDAGQRFAVTVSDAVPGDPDDGGGTVPVNGMVPIPAEPPDAVGSAIWDARMLGDEDPDLGLAVIAGLADDVVISSTPKGVDIRMSWPAAPVQAPTL